MSCWNDEWQERVSGVTAAFERMTDAERKTLEGLACGMVTHKEAMQRIVAQIDAAGSCAGCGGACCVSGRYHFGAADLLVYLATKRPLFAPRFENGLCPFLGEGQCLIPAGYRPFNCITFNCDLIEERLSQEEVARFYGMERELKKLYTEIRSLFPTRSMDGSLL